jgi:outer membrane protein TolC
MGSIVHLLKYGLLVLAAAGVAMLGSCQSMGLGSIKHSLVDPFRKPDHITVSLSKEMNTMMNNRVVPSSAALGKRDLTLEDCRAMALRNNLELQSARTQELTKQAINFSNKTRILPHFLVSGDLSERENLPYSYSDIGAEQGKTPAFGGSGSVANWAIGHERSTFRYSIETRWSPTDAALAYYVSRSGANDRLKAHYQKIRVAQKLIGVVDAAFFRLLGLQHCVDQAGRVLDSRSVVSDKMKMAFERKLIGLAEYDRARNLYIRSKRQLSKFRNELEKQRNILASAMGLSSDYCVDGGFYLVGNLTIPVMNNAICDLEMAALRNRPEAIESGLSHLNTVNDYKRAIIKYFPKATGYWRLTHDKDRYLYNKDWKEVGAMVYFDLLDWVANIGEARAAGSDSRRTEQEMGAVALAIASQVRTAAITCLDSSEEIKSAEEFKQSAEEALHAGLTRASRDDLDRLALEEIKANKLQAALEENRAIAEANASFAELQAATGVNYNEPEPTN